MAECRRVEVDMFESHEAERMLEHPVPVSVSLGSSKRQAVDRWFSVGVATMVIALTVVSFAPALVAPATRTVPLPFTPLVMAHALVAAAFLLVFLAQAILVATGRTAVHRRLGVVGVLLAVMFTVVGSFAAIAETRRGFDLSGDLVPRGTLLDPAIVLAPVIGVLLFAVLVCAAVVYRRRPGVHKRLMILALVGALAPAPVAHLVGHWPALQPHAIPLAIAVNFCLLCLTPAYERITRGRTHPVSLWGGVGVFACLNVFFGFVVPSAPWHALADWLAGRG